MKHTSTKQNFVSDTVCQPLDGKKEMPAGNLAELAWAAGFIDGEGCISVVKQIYQKKTRRNYYIRLRLQAVQNDLASLQHLQRILGVRGAINQIKWYPSQTRPIYTFLVDGRHAIEALEKIEPFLIRKRHQARACFDLWREGKMGVRTGQVPQEIWDIREYYLKRLQRMK